jgi:hypothetical protein
MNVNDRYIHEDFQQQTMFSFTTIDQNQDCVAKKSINLFQGNIIDEVLPLVFYDLSSTQGLVHDKCVDIGFYNIDLIFYQYKIEDVQSYAASFTKISRRNMSIFDHHDTESKLVIEEHVSKVDLSKNVISAPLYVSYEGFDEGFQIDELFSFVLEGTNLDHCE